MDCGQQPNRGQADGRAARLGRQRFWHSLKWSANWHVYTWQSFMVFDHWGIPAPTGGHRQQVGWGGTTPAHCGVAGSQPGDDNHIPLQADSRRQQTRAPSTMAIGYLWQWGVSPVQQLRQLNACTEPAAGSTTCVQPVAGITRHANAASAAKSA